MPRKEGRTRVFEVLHPPQEARQRPTFVDHVVVCLVRLIRLRSHAQSVQKSNDATEARLRWQLEHSNSYGAPTQPGLSAATIAASGQAPNPQSVVTQEAQHLIS